MLRMSPVCPRVRVTSPFQGRTKYTPFALSLLKVRRGGSKGLKSGLFRVQGRAKA